MEDKGLFKTFPTIEDARGLIDILETNEIEFSLVEDAYEVDITFTGNKASDIQVFINHADFESVNKLVEKDAASQIDLTNRDHYLFEFTTEELYDILRKRDEWNPHDYVLAKEILNERGETINQEKLDELQEERNMELDAPENSNQLRVALGYVFALLGGFFGIVIGVYLIIATKTTSDGTRVYLYSDMDRRHGKAITIIALFIFALALALKYDLIFELFS